MCDCNDYLTMIAQLQDRMNTVEAELAPLSSGHPLLALHDAGDIAAFDTVTGFGSGTWTGWGIANGNTYVIGSVTVITQDMRDNVPVGSGLTYTTGQLLGASSVTLVTSEIPTHLHPVTDPGHVHTATSAAHTHAVTDPGHLHASTQAAHSHTITTDTQGNHTHVTSIGGTGSILTPSAATNAGLLAGGFSADTLADNGAHIHSGTTNTATPVITVASASTGITTGNTGGSLGHNNMQPSRGTFWVQKIS